MRKFIVVFCLFSILGKAQTAEPKITGKVVVSIENGTFDCDLTLSDYPQISDYVIRLNSGLNILNFQAINEKPFLIYYEKANNDSTSTGESTAYYFPNNNRTGKFLPQKVRVRYTGKFPVIRDTLTDKHAREDWKGNLAFNGKSLRADGNQSAWYPILYDMKSDVAYGSVRYDIDFECIDCSTLYINGNEPKKAKKFQFKSEVSREMSLFLGNYDFVSNNATFILNPDLSSEEIQSFTELINDYKSYYVEKLGIPYDLSVNIISTTPTSANNGWMFVSYPSIYNIGWGKNGLKSLFDPNIQNWYRPFMAHELAHYYFGTYRVFNSNLGDMMSEGFSEYLSFKVTEKFLGKAVLEEKFKKKKQELKGFKPTLFKDVKSQSDYKDRELYVYYYAPLLFWSIEQEIGEERMVNWLKFLLQQPTKFTDYAFMDEMLKKAIVDKNLYQKVKKELLDNPKFLTEKLK